MLRAHARPNDPNNRECQPRSKKTDSLEEDNDLSKKCKITQNALNKNDPAKIIWYNQLKAITFY